MKGDVEEAVGGIGMERKMTCFPLWSSFQGETKRGEIG